MQNLNLSPSKKIYIASDFHLGYSKDEADLDSLEREKKILRFLEMARKDAELIILLGDIFDFWYEYKKAIPKGFVRLQGKIAEITDSGINVVFFTGNHDLWMFGYFEKELGVKVYHKPQNVIWNNKKIHLGHGDGLGNGDYSYKFMKKALFKNPFCRFFFEWLHPNIGIGLAHFWSNSRKPSKKASNKKPKQVEKYRGKEKEWIWNYCNEIHQTNPQDYYVFGHRHLPLMIEMDTKKTVSSTESETESNDKSYYFNTGEWINQFTYLVFEVENTDSVATFKRCCFEADTKWIID
ncbi:MAG: UDP-2,3-diacylglucosamine hydrolase [Flexibacter sp. CG_4_10_14_3_um_filter_32_15]|nr:MAG: UDP-2,3-diacylglucosamine hydrolase [Flexibacter sp. CG_4_10_14_3_um_filter_32_15]